MRLLLFNLKTDEDDAVLGFTTDWIHALAPRFDRIVVITMTAGALRPRENVTVWSVGKELGWGRLRRAAEFYRLLWRALRKQKVEVCFAHMNHRFALLAWPLLAAWRVPVVLWYSHRKVTAELRLAALLVRRVVTSTEGGFGIATVKRRVIGQGIDTERFRPSAARCEPFRILSLGRISPVKRLEVLIRAVGILARERPGLRFQTVFAGAPAADRDFAYLKRLRELAAAEKVEHLVEFAGAVPHREAHQVFAGAGCFVNVTATDSLEKAVLEAMSAAVPVITSVGSFSRVLGPELGPEWVVERATPAELAGRLARLIGMPEPDRRELGSRLREIVVRDHSLARLAGELEREIREAAARPAAGEEALARP